MWNDLLYQQSRSKMGISNSTAFVKGIINNQRVRPSAREAASRQKEDRRF